MVKLLKKTLPHVLMKDTDSKTLSLCLLIHFNSAKEKVSDIRFILLILVRLYTTLSTNLKNCFTVLFLNWFYI